MKTLYLRACVPARVYPAALRLYMVRNARAYHALLKKLLEKFSSILGNAERIGCTVEHRMKVFDRIEKIPDFTVRKSFLIDNFVIEYFSIFLCF